MVDLWRNWQPVLKVDKTDHATNLFSREAVGIIEKHAEASPDDPMFL